eukprot:TRINITY_DN2586_c0_g1_i1.p1 TRINITY_DN2586_c0_g1~~TRINITY_DN2586_c0_g1_i1.p1  ORF type:complete len:161 (-),score=57.28 TRINITY_DN2586_c0_g1_i1:123-605(-)
MAEKDSLKLKQKYGLSQDKFEEYREAFEVFDKDGSGTITVEELHQVITSMGQKCSLKDAKQMIAEVDADKNETIELGEFIEMMEKKSKKQDKGDELLEAFKTFDKNGDGKISHSELKIVMKSMGNNMDDSEITQMIEAADLDGDKEISFEEFKAMMGEQK